MQTDADFAVKLREVAHRYAARTALDDISLAVPPGSSVALVGPDGVGKSTMLGLIAGARRLQTGALRVLDGDMGSASHRSHRPPHRLYAARPWPQSLSFPFGLREPRFFGGLFGIGTTERRERIDRLLEATGLDPFPDRPAGKLSGGMKQKLSLCSALIHDPDVLVLDEPTTGIDPLSRRQFWSLIDNLKTERPTMTVLVSTAFGQQQRNRQSGGSTPQPLWRLDRQGLDAVS